MDILGMIIVILGFYCIIGMITMGPVKFRCSCGKNEACSLCGKSLSIFRIIFGWPIYIIVRFIDVEDFYVDDKDKRK